MGNQKSDSVYPVCSIEQLNHAECHEFRLLDDQTEGFLVNWRGKYFAYFNSCPHTQVNLNWTPNQFLDIDSQFIQCSLHGALFEPDTGLCIRGPCLGQSLTCLPVVEQDGMVCITLQSQKPA